MMAQPDPDIATMGRAIARLIVAGKTVRLPIEWQLSILAKAVLHLSEKVVP